MAEQKIVFFLGNGAAMAEMSKKTSTDKLLAQAIKEFPRDSAAKKVKKFIENLFLVNTQDDEDYIPTFEEVITLIDVCLQKKEEISGIWKSNTLNDLRNKMTYLLYKIIDNRLKEPKGIHEKFVEKLFKEKSDCRKYSFISLNYDILLDRPLVDIRDTELGLYLDFGIYLRNFELKEELEREPYTARKYKWDKPKDGESILLLKLHGSLSWLYCPTCNTIIATPKEKGLKYIYDPQIKDDNILKKCVLCDSERKPVIIPPTWQKEYINPNLIEIWLKAERELQKADEIFFIGYSLPESDVNVRYLLKKGLYRKNEYVEVNIINLAGQDSLERKRYRRLFGNSIHYDEKIDFEEFVDKIEEFIRS